MRGVEGVALWVLELEEGTDFGRALRRTNHQRPLPDAFIVVARCRLWSDGPLVHVFVAHAENVLSEIDVKVGRAISSCQLIRS